MKKIITNEENIRLDKFLADNTSYSRAQVDKMIANGQVLVNKQIKKASYLIKINDEIEWEELVQTDDIKPNFLPLKIIYEDQDIMVIDKASGVVVHPGNGNHDHTLVNGLKYYTNNLSDLNGEFRCGIVHRIDKDTSGLMLVAKTNAAHQILAEDFKVHAVKRTYIALLCGNLPYNEATIDAPIKRDSKHFNQMGVFEDGKQAITHLKVIKRYNNYTLVKLNLETGRTHQIRVHMKYIGYPIYNDPVYNTKKANDFGQFLHSQAIDFIHPITKEKMHFECELPKEFQDFLDTL